MRVDIISQKALTILQSIYSFKKIDKILGCLNQENETDNPFENFSIFDYYNVIYENILNTLIELSILLRREKESYERYGKNINKLVKYNNVAKYSDNKKDISFSDILSKIIHSNDIVFQIKDTNGMTRYGYDRVENCEFTGVVHISTEEKDGNKRNIDVDVLKLCVNATMVKARSFC